MTDSYSNACWNNFIEIIQPPSKPKTVVEIVKLHQQYLKYSLITSTPLQFHEEGNLVQLSYHLSSHLYWNIGGAGGGGRRRKRKKKLTKTVNYSKAAPSFGK